ncbi:hypothetical protein QU38_00340, partial [Staphylococcus aureus]
HQLDAACRGYGQAVRTAGGAGQGSLAAPVVAAQSHDFEHQQRQHEGGSEQEIGQVGQPVGKPERQREEQRQPGKRRPRARDTHARAGAGRHDGKRYAHGQRPNRLHVESRKQRRCPDRAQGQADHGAALS